MAINKKILTTVLTTTASVASVGAVAGIALNNQQQTSIVESNSNNKLNSFEQITNDNKPEPSKKPIIQNQTVKTYSASMRLVDENFTQDNKNETKYVLTITDNIREEGVIYFVNSENPNDFSQQLEFKPGDTITVGIKMNEGFEKYTARELKVVGKNPAYGVPSKNVEGKKDQFTIKMPKYEETINEKTGESWFYGESTDEIKLIPTFIKESIGVNDNKVDWEHGSLHDTFNGYVYELKEDTTWTSAKEKIYETFENKEITNPIDIFFYMNGHTITFDVDTINLDVPSGWALHFYNNKNDTISDDGKYGEIKVSSNHQYAELGVKGSVTLGNSIKFRQYAGVNGIRFVDFSNTSLFADFVENIPNGK